MPRNPYPEHPVRDEFLRRLRAFYTDCGRPRYALIVAMSRRLGDLYPDPHRWESLPTFSASALSETLNGRRRGLPEPGWVAGFVLCCQRIAYETGHLTADPGRGSLDIWQALLQQAEAESARLGLPHRPGPREPLSAAGEAGTAASASAPGPAGAQPDPAAGPGAVFGSAVPVRATASPPPPAGPGFIVTGPVHLDEAQYAYVTGYGPYGRKLLERALARQAHAVYQIGVLLAAEVPRADQALSALTYAAATGHPQALELLQASPGQLDRRLAAEHAGELARQAAEAGVPEAAAAFRDCLARHAADGNAGAAHRSDGGTARFGTEAPAVPTAASKARTSSKDRTTP